MAHSENNTPGASLLDYLKAWPQYLLPHHLLSRQMLRITRIRTRWFKNLFIKRFIRAFNVDMSQAQESDPRAFADFNSFFTRALKPDARPIARGTGELACPVDGTVSQVGKIEQGQVFQAKGHSYSLETLLGGETSLSDLFQDGSFATLYLSPRDYHRIHMPVTGNLRQMVHVPGRLFSVNAATTRAVPGLFARNERVIALFDTELGPMAMILVGALFVSSIETVWHGVVTPPSHFEVRHWHYDAGSTAPLQHGAEMGRFNMGSTVIMLFAKDKIAWDAAIQANNPIRMGQVLAKRA